MTPAYKAKRKAKHEIEKSDRKLRTRVPVPDLTIDLTPSGQRLAWLGGKQFVQGNGGRKNLSGHLPEHLKALEDNKAFDLKAKAVIDLPERTDAL
jgi:hypothetical protein